MTKLTLLNYLNTWFDSMCLFLLFRSLLVTNKNLKFFSSTLAEKSVLRIEQSASNLHFLRRKFTYQKYYALRKSKYFQVIMPTRCFTEHEMILLTFMSLSLDTLICLWYHLGAPLKNHSKLHYFTWTYSILIYINYFQFQYLLSLHIIHTLKYAK